MPLAYLSAGGTRYRDSVKVTLLKINGKNKDGILLHRLKVWKLVLLPIFTFVVK